MTPNEILNSHLLMFRHFHKKPFEVAFAYRPYSAIEETEHYKALAPLIDWANDSDMPEVDKESLISLIYDKVNDALSSINPY